MLPYLVSKGGDLIAAVSVWIESILWIKLVVKNVVKREIGFENKKPVYEAVFVQHTVSWLATTIIYLRLLYAVKDATEHHAQRVTPATLRQMVCDTMDALICLLD
jgi:hypothetical protein